MITQEQANHLFEYKDGALYWKNAVRPSFNGKKVGCDDGQGYIRFTVNKKQYFAHRIIYLMHHGKLPVVIDHADRNVKNNCIENLRDADASKNGMNANSWKKSAVGCRNVYQKKGRNKFSVAMRINKKSTFIGNFDDLELADLVATEARSKYHGKFAFHLSNLNKETS
jgi:hypothetical protein